MADRSTTTLDSPTANEDVGTMTGESTHPLAEAGKEAGERAGHLVERGAQLGIQQADRGLDQAATGVETVADTIRRVSIDAQSDQPQIAELASTAADQAESLARYLRETDVREMIGSVETFARKQPLLFLGGAFVLGMAVSRFIKAAGGSQSESQRFAAQGDYRSGYRTGSHRSFEATGPGTENGYTDSSEGI